MTPVGARQRGATFDAGILIGLDRDDRALWARLRIINRRAVVPVIPAPVVTQVWRSPRQANLARALGHCRIEPTDAELARRAGELCGAAGSSDAVDAIVVASAARRGDTVFTSDPTDLRALSAHVRGVAVVET